MKDSEAGGRGRLVVRGGVELLVVVVGVVLALAVDRWVAGIDDRQQADQLAAQLLEDIQRDSVAMAELVGQYESLGQSGLDLLEIVADPDREVEDPEDFVRGVEFIGWWLPFNANRDTWDQVLATGQLGLFTDPGLRAALTSYYGYLDYVAQLEERWRPVIDDYWRLERAVLPPLLRIRVIEGRTTGTPADVSPAEVAPIIAAFRTDPALNGALGHVTTVYRYGTPPLRDLFGHAAVARAALLAR